MTLELSVALRAVLPRLPNLRLAVDEQELQWSASHTIRSRAAVPLAWGPNESSVASTGAGQMAAVRVS